MDHTATLLSIKKTLAYFDQFAYPLTAEELYRWLWEPPAHLSWADFLTVLGSAVATGKCVLADSYYALPGRADTVLKRHERLLLVESKLALARRAATILSAVPFVRGIFVCNTVAAGWPTRDSDIDVLVVTRAGRLWLARLLVTLAAAGLNMRRGKKHIADKVCLSFYVTETHLNLDSVRITAPDVYLTYWLYQLMPVYDPGNLLLQIHQANSWTKKFIPNAAENIQFHPDLFARVTFVGKMLKIISEKILQGTLGITAERLVRGMQKERIAKQKHNEPPAVVISDDMLKFHEYDRRLEYQMAWRNRW